MPDEGSARDDARPFDRAKQCGAKTRHGGPCRQAKGARTGHKGTGSCFLHGGRSPNGRKHAQREQAEKAIKQAKKSPALRDVLALIDRGALTGDAKAALREMLAVALWREQALRLTAERDPGPLYAANHSGDGVPGVLWQMHGDAIKATAVIAKMLTDQETADDYVEVERAKLRTVADALEGAFADAEVEPGLRDRVMRGMVARLRPAMAQLPSGVELS